MKIRRILGSLRSLVFTRLDPFEYVQIWRLKRLGTLITIRDLIPAFEGSTFFAFATGGSLSNIQGLERVGDHNVLMLTTAPVHFFQMYGVMPNLWLIHNPASVRMALRAIDSYGLRNKIDFSNTFVLVPRNNSKSKIVFSSPRMRKLRRAIGPTTYALYTEILYSGNETAEDFISGSAVPESYLKRGVEPIELMNGSSVEAAFLPFLSFLGVREIYFGGVDHRNTGHFWDRNDPWQNENGTPKMFDDAALVQASGVTAMREARSKGIAVYRLEANMTALKHYDHIEFQNALSRSTKRVGVN